jgi:hypothetical protein
LKCLILYFKPTELLTAVLSSITIITRLQCLLGIQVDQAYRCMNGKVTQHSSEEERETRYPSVPNRFGRDCVVVLYSRSYQFISQPGYQPSEQSCECIDSIIRCITVALFQIHNFPHGVSYALLTFISLKIYIGPPRQSAYGSTALSWILDAFSVS